MRDVVVVTSVGEDDVGQEDWSSSAPSLAAFQETFQRALLTGDAEILADLKDNSRTSRDVLFGVYRHGYTARLIEVLAADYGMLHTYMGDVQFEALARAYIGKYPSDTENARWFGRHLPSFLKHEKSHSSRPELADLARLEFALGLVFDAADSVPLSFAELAAFQREDWARLVFAPHPAVEIVTCQTDAMALWLAMRDGARPPSLVAPDGPQRICVWRQGVMPKLRPMGAEEAMMWTEATQGVTFGTLCEMAATFAEPETAAVRAAQYLQGWLAADMLAGARLADA